MSIIKTCVKCQEAKSLNLFRKKQKKNKIYFSKTCKKCVINMERLYKHNYYLTNKTKIQNQNKINYKNNKDKRLQSNKIYYQKNKEKLIEKQKEYFLKNPQIKKKSNYNYHLNHKEKERQYRLNYKRPNRSKKTISPFYKLRKSVSRSIALALKKVGYSKNNLSILDYLPYDINELHVYLEKLFGHPDNLTPDGKIWMSWNNWGKYNFNTWKDNDYTTWKWNLDHIIPQADLPYISMEDENFKKCWSLENLRPYSAKQNILDGVNKIRHNRKV